MSPLITAATALLGVWLAYRLSDWLDARGVRDPGLYGYLLFAAVFMFLVWFNGGELLGSGESCFGSANTATC